MFILIQPAEQFDGQRQNCSLQRSIRTQARVPKAPPSQQCTKRKSWWRRRWKIFY